MIMKKKCFFIIMVIGLLAVAGSVFFVLNKKNKYEVTFIGLPERDVIVEYGDAFKEPTVVALFKGSIFEKEGKAFDIIPTGAVDLNKLGIYTLEYSAEYKKCSATSKINVKVVDTVPPVLTLTTDKNKYTKPNEAYVEEGFKALDNYDGDITDKVVRTESREKIIYSIEDSSGNTTTLERKINYKDSLAPELTLLGDENLYVDVTVGYVEPGFTAVDDCDGDITDRVKVETDYVENTIGEYDVIYRVKDSYDNETVAKRHIIVKDLIPPAMQLNGEGSMYIAKGSKYADAGCVAIDAYDGAVTYTTSGSVNPNANGVYTISYTATDKSGNTASLSRIVYVFTPQEDVEKITPDDKVIYLTFDDGPSAYTMNLLDILDKYNVKATFFLTGYGAEYRKAITEESKRGHTVAIHSYTHRYNEIYQSPAAFMQDVLKVRDIIISLTKKEPWLMRFAGGTSNSYIEGRRDQFRDTVTRNGFEYVDWNVSSEDALGTLTTAQIVANVKNGILGLRGKKNAIVLQHDTYRESVAGVEEIIVWGLANGYKFLPITKDTPLVHHMS